MFKQSYPKFFDFVKTRIARAMLEIKNLLKLRGITNFKYKEILFLLNRRLLVGAYDTLFTCGGMCLSSQFDLNHLLRLRGG